MSDVSILDKSKFGLYPVVSSLEWLECMLELGVKTVQLRIKDLNHPQLKESIKSSIALGKKYQAQVFINDYWQYAIEYGAFGVHLGQEDLQIADVSKIKKAGLCLGVSTHSYTEILKILRYNPDYIALGHVFPTTTKVMPSQPQGLKRLACEQKLLHFINKFKSKKILTVAIGGIDLSNVRAVLNCGVDGIAVVRAITHTHDHQQAVAKFNTLLNQRN